MAKAAGLFFSRSSEVITLNRRIRPSDDQREYLLQRKDEISAWLISDLADLGMEVSTFIQGSYRFHTLIKPIVSGDEYDVDLGLYFKGKNSADIDPADLREVVQKSLVRFWKACDEIKAVEVEKERCSRVTYTKKFHIDVPVYHETPAGRIVRLATLSGGWERSDPESMLVWFGKSIGDNASDRALIRRLIRYIKAWSVLTFRDPISRPSSLMLTILAIDAYASEGCQDDEDDDALAKVVRSIYERMVLNRVVPNPITGDSDLDVNRLSTDHHAGFLQQLSRFVDSAERAVSCDSMAEAAVTWAEVFSYAFPLPEDLGLLSISTSNGLEVPSPRFRIRILEADCKTLVQTYNDHVPHCRVGQRLRFEIVNPEVIPSGAEVRWVVRNNGSDAMSISDLGHLSKDDGGLNTVEHAEYRGSHYMDCEVWLHGQLRSLSRIGVNIDRTVMPPRVPPRKPAYTKLVKRR